MWPRKLLWVSLSGSSESESLPEVGGEGSGHRGSSFSAWMSAPGGGREMGVHVKDLQSGGNGSHPVSSSQSYSYAHEGETDQPLKGGA